MATKYTVFKGHNSPITVRITKANGVFYSASEMSGIARVYLKYIPDTDADPEYADSDVTPTYFDWSTYASESLLLFDMGLSDFTVGADSKLEVIVYDLINPEGRVVAQLDVEVSDEALGDIALVDVLSIIEAGESTLVSPLTITDADYQVLSADVLGNRSLRALPSITDNITLIEGQSTFDGKFLYVSIIEDGSITVTCAGTNKIGNATSTVLTITGDPYAHVPLEYVHSIGTWLVHRTGGISGS